MSGPYDEEPLDIELVRLRGESEDYHRVRDERDTAVRGWAESMQRNLELQAEIDRLRALVDAVGEKVCEVALRVKALTEHE